MIIANKVKDIVHVNRGQWLSGVVTDMINIFRVIFTTTIKTDIRFYLFFSFIKL